VYQDESGDAKSCQENFIVGLLRVRDREPIWQAIKTVRNSERFAQELHFSTTSDKRERIYVEILKSVKRIESTFSFSAIVIKNSLIDLRRFSGKRYLAYNFFTRLLMEHRSTEVVDAIFYTDHKSRIKRDNFFQYLETSTNLAHGTGVLRKVESMNSKQDDIIQLTDLLIGCVNNRTGHCLGERKVRVRKVAYELGLTRDV
jgi:hypothetical protein